MQPSASPQPPPSTTPEPQAAPAPAPASEDAQPAPAAPRIDLSAMEPPRRLAEARLEDVTIDGICGVY